LLPVEPAVEAPVRPTTLENDRFQSEQPSRRKRASRALARFLVAFCIGVTATLAWQSYGDAAREMIANSYPQLGWLAPQAEPVAQNAPETIALVAPAAASFDQQQPNAISLDLDAVRQGIDQIAASIAAIQEQMSRSADRIATEQIARSVAKLTAGQEQMTRESRNCKRSNNTCSTRTQNLPRGRPLRQHATPFRGRRRHRWCADGHIRSAGPPKLAYGRPMVERPRAPAGTWPCAWPANW
jgi:hypothetical protein